MVSAEIFEGSEGLRLKSTQYCWNIVQIFGGFLIFKEFILGFVEVCLWAAVRKRQFIIASKGCNKLLQIRRLRFWWHWLSSFLQSSFLVLNQLFITLQSYWIVFLIFFFFRSSVIVDIMIHFILSERSSIIYTLLLFAVVLGRIFDSSIDNIWNVLWAWRGFAVIKLCSRIVVAIAILISIAHKVDYRCRFSMPESLIGLISLQK